MSPPSLRLRFWFAVMDALVWADLYGSPAYLWVVRRAARAAAVADADATDWDAP